MDIEPNLSRKESVCIGADIPDSSLYSNQSPQKYGLDNQFFLKSQIPQVGFQFFLDYSKDSSYDWYYCHSHTPLFF